MKIKNIEEVEELSDSEESTEELDIDNDSDLEEAFSKGILKPGLFKPNAKPVVKKKQFINNVGRIRRKLEEMKYKGAWIERLDMINDLAPLAPEIALKLEEQEKSGIVIDKVNNEFERELGFYRQAQAAVLEGIPRLQSMGIPTKRPDDYMAEMAKTDDHMQKVRENLLKKQTEEERRDKIRQFRKLQKFSKKVQAEQRVAKQAEKKALLDEVKKFRKGQRKDLDFLDDDDDKKKKPQAKKRKLDASGNPQQSKGKIKRSQLKRQHKEAKYGQGGRKRDKKRNTRESTSDVFGNRSNNRKGFPTKGKNKQQQRPGKAKRQKMKNKNRK